MDNSVNNISQDYYQVEAQAQKDIPKTSNEKTESQTQADAAANETNNGQTDQVEITGKSSEAATAERREDTKEKVSEETATQSQDLEQSHNPNPGDIVEILA